MTACIDIVRREVSDLTDKELDEVLEQMRGRQANLIRGGADASTAAAQAGMEVAETLRAAAAIERRNALINRRIRIEALDYLNTTWGDNLAEGVLSILYGSSFAREGSRASVNAAQSANFRRYMGGVFGELEAAGLFDVLKRGELDRDVFVAMRSINDAAALKKLPEQAVAIAKTLTKWQEVSRIEANRAGAWIGKVDDYGLRQTHNSDRLMRAGEAKWKADILPRLDLPRMFPDGPPKDLDDWLHETFLNIVTGVRDANPSAGKMAAFKGPGNLAKKLSQERVLHFRTADDAFQYNIDYGMGNIRESYVTGMHQAAESTGLMQVLGTNPEYNLRAVVDAVRSRLSRSDPAALKKFDDATRSGKRIDNAYLEVSGQTRRAASARLAAVGQGIRVWNTLTGLGGAVVSAVTDVPIRASLLRYQGQSYLQQLGKGLLGPLTRLADSMDSADRKAVLSAAGYFNEVAMGNLASRFSPDDTIPGALNRATNTFFKWNLLAQWTDSMRRSTLEAMSHYWGGIADRPYAQLSDRNRMALTRFRISEKEWGVISKGITEADGRKFLTPEAVRELPDDQFTPLAHDRINALKAGVAEKVTKRLERDKIESDWSAERRKRYQLELSSSQQKLAERIANADARLSGELRDLQSKLVQLYDNVDTSGSYWQTVKDRMPKLGELRRHGVRQGRLEARASEVSATQRRIVRELEAMKDDLGSAFTQRWLGKESALQSRLMTASDEEVDSLSDVFTQAFTDANAALSERLARADETAKERFVKRSEQVKELAAKLAETDAYWRKAEAAKPTTTELRQAGVSEGRAREASKNIKSEARQISRDLERLKKELNEDFIERWSERADDLTTFADRMAARIKEREAANTRDLAGLEPQIDRILDDTRAQMADRLQQFYADDLDSAVISPDARTQAFIRQGQQAGTPIGEALRMFWQFKSFGIAIMQRAFLRELRGYGPKASVSQAKGIALLMLGSLGFGYMAMTLKDLIKGKTPRPLDNPKTWTAAMAQGGGMGIYGDFLFGESSRLGGGFLETLGGPTVGKLADTKRLFDAAKSGEDVGAQGLRFVVSNTPGNNLFYSRMALDYLFLWEVQEALSPGYLRRMERRAEEERGQQWWLRPSEAVNLP